MRRTTSWALAAAPAGLWLALVALGLALELAGRVNTDESFLMLFTAAYALGGALVVGRQPRNPIGWIMVALALNFVLNALATGYVEPVADPGERPLGELVLLYYGVNEQIWIPLVGVFLPLLFPDGRLPSRRWRPFFWLAVASVACALVGNVFDAGLVDQAEWPGLENPFAVEGALAPLVDLARIVSTALFVPMLVGAGAAVVIRLRRARGVERQQLKWFTYAAGLMAAGLIVAGLAVVAEESGAEETTWGYAIGATGWFTALFAILIALPVAIALAVFRYRLYDIDVVVNRTLVYGSLTALLAGAYLGLVLLFQLAFSPVTEGNGLAVALSTLAVAGLFRPARARVQGLVDRRFYRRRYDAQRTLDGFAGRLREEIDLDALRAELTGVVAQTVQPAHVSLWLRETGAET